MISYSNPFLSFSNISVMKYFTIDFICNYNMDHYPFDIQECQGIVSITTESDFFVKLIAKDLMYKGPTNLMQYVLDNISFIKTDEVSNVDKFKTYFKLYQAK